MNKLKEIREWRGMGQLKLAQETGIGQNIISHLENEKIRAYPGWRKRITEVLDVPIEEIWPDAKYCSECGREMEMKE